MKKEIRKLDMVHNTTLVLYLCTEQYDIADDAGKNLITNDYDTKDIEDLIKGQLV
jgi:hypothetical protein